MVPVEARRTAEIRSAATVVSGSVEVAEVPVRRVISLTERRSGDPVAVIAGLPADTRPLPTVAVYDELLTRRAAQDTTSAAGSEVS